MISLLFLSVISLAQDHATVGSKAFTEGYILGEFASQKLEEQGLKVQRKFGLGGTGILFEALKAKQIDLYPEYTSTISMELLKRPDLLEVPQLRAALNELGFTISDPIGFANNYAIAVSRTFADKYNVKTISDLAKLSGARAVFSNEFMTRADGYVGLQSVYGLHLQTHSLEHSLAFEAIAGGQADVTDVYTTEGKIRKFDLVVLEDDMKYFPEYDAVWLARSDFVRDHQKAWNQLNTFTLDVETMRRWNEEADVMKKPFAQVIKASVLAPDVRFKELAQRTREHLEIVGIALLCACLLGIPLGILAAFNENAGRLILLICGVLQTIPSLALLCFLIPLFGIGLKAALAALIFYGLLPIVLNTYTGLRSIDENLRQVTKALGLTFWQGLVHIDIPLALPSIVSGVRTSAIIGIGTATLAALIGAGGYGVPIVTGLAVNDIRVILTGAVPAGVMALAVDFAFSMFERRMFRRR